MPAVIANARTLPQRSLTLGGSRLGACMHATLARWPFVTPSSRFNDSDAVSDLRIGSDSTRHASFCMCGAPVALDCHVSRASCPHRWVQLAPRLIDRGTLEAHVQVGQSAKQG